MRKIDNIRYFRVIKQLKVVELLVKLKIAIGGNSGKLSTNNNL